MLQEISSKDIFNQVKSSLISIYEESEAQNISYWLLEKLFLLTKQEVMLDKKRFEDADLLQTKLSQAVARLLRHEPIQYILGEAYFYGLDFIVTPAVLIPRPETEELVQLIIQENAKQENLTILDIGTGSGCIAISLAKNLRNAQIYAIDISENALEVARENAKKQEVKINFLQSDILKIYENESEKVMLSTENARFLSDLRFDIIVSNPPYISELEKKKMHANVLDYEPSQALFVPDHTPLLFYEKIALLAQKQLKVNGKLYFEINEAFGNEVVSYLDSSDFKQIRLIKDLQGKDRIVSSFFNP